MWYVLATANIEQFVSDGVLAATALCPSRNGERATPFPVAHAIGARYGQGHEVPSWAIRGAQPEAASGRLEDRAVHRAAVVQPRPCRL